MKRRMLHNAVVALGVVSATVAASLLATGAISRSTRDASAIAASSVVSTTNLPRPLVRRDRELSAGLHVLDLVGLDTAHTGPAYLPQITITLPTGWRSIHGQRPVVDANYLPMATTKDRAELTRVVQSIRFLSASAKRTNQLRSRRQPAVRNGEWIGYATAAPGDQQRYYGGSGSDVFITRPGGQPKLVAGRGSRSKIWNVCPAFSPNGTLLAFGRRAPHALTIGVVGVASDGSIGAPRITLAVPDINHRAPCPKWSTDSSRLAYLDSRHKLIVRGLDGLRRPRRAGDPRPRDFNRSDSPAVGPDGRLVARLEDCGIVASRPDGSERRVIPDQPCSYAISGWSPDGRKLLVMRDVNGGFGMRAVSVNAPFTATTVVAYVRVNNARSWPRYGDVSWQPIPR